MLRRFRPGFQCFVLSSIIASSLVCSALASGEGTASVFASADRPIQPGANASLVLRADEQAAAVNSTSLDKTAQPTTGDGNAGNEESHVQRADDAAGTPDNAASKNGTTAGSKSPESAKSTESTTVTEVSSTKSPTSSQATSETSSTDNAPTTIEKLPSTSEESAGSETTTPSTGLATSSEKSAMASNEAQTSGQLGPQADVATGIVALVMAIVFAVTVIIVYFGLLAWRRYLEYRYGNRELLVNDLEFDTNDLRHFEL